jgi:hypothetical protein
MSEYLLTVKTKVSGALPTVDGLPTANPFDPYTVLLVGHSDPKKNGPYMVVNGAFQVHGDFAMFATEHDRVEVTVLDEANIYVLEKTPGAAAGTYDQAWTLDRPMPAPEPEPPLLS